MDMDTTQISTRSDKVNFMDTVNYCYGYYTAITIVMDVDIERKNIDFLLSLLLIFFLTKNVSLSSLLLILH